MFHQKIMQCIFLALLAASNYEFPNMEQNHKTVIIFFKLKKHKQKNC